MSYCKITPTITNIKGKEVDSKLFKELFNLTKDRELTKKIWGLTRVPGFLKLENLQLDENGEPTEYLIGWSAGLYIISLDKKYIKPKK